MSHTKEPWCVSGVTHLHRIAQHDESGRDCYDTPIIWAEEASLQGKMEDKLRAVDCVNACAGLPDPKENIKELLEMVKVLAKEDCRAGLQMPCRVRCLTCKAYELIKKIKGKQ